MFKKQKSLKIAIIGLGYVGLPLALEFAKKREVVGYDIDRERISELKIGKDKNLEFSKSQITRSSRLIFTNNISKIKSASFFIITVPTPINKSKKPDLNPLMNSTKLISKILKKNDIVIYESTVYPGCVEEFCVPILEKFSKLKFNKDFFCGYSPERINPGDKKRKIANIKKVTSGSTPMIANLIDDLYGEIITAGTHKAPSIKVAEAAKIIENTQRDLNIALINELSILFDHMNIDTQSVLSAAKSKWNFLQFEPGLVGGHCIGVDPYYLTYKAKSIGYNPKIILAGRKLNDDMGFFVVKKLISKMKKNKIKIKGSKILIMGLTFKENCSDVRNSGIQMVIKELRKYSCLLEAEDPYIEKNQIRKTFNVNPKSNLEKKRYDVVIISVAHNIYKRIGINYIKDQCKDNHIIFDIKNTFNSKLVNLKL